MKIPFNSDPESSVYFYVPLLAVAAAFLIIVIFGV